MRKDKNVKNYTEAELKANRAASQADLNKVDAITDEELELIIADFLEFNYLSKCLQNSGVRQEIWE